ncbi:hypothetical protein ZWY2020_048199 [Hordeum vulgare]|nr:hypothetical protein ZWY2020_048199 [Hordeum vulgare]
MTARRVPRPSHGKVLNVPCASEDEDEADDEILEAINKNKQERVAQAKDRTQPKTPKAHYIVELPHDSSDDIPPTHEPARAAEEIFVAEETAQTRRTASAIPEENATRAPKSSQVKKVKLPSATQVKKTKVTEKEAAKKRKASTSSESSEAKRLRTLPTSSTAPIDATPINVALAYMMVPFGVGHVIEEVDEEMEENSSAASTPIDDEIEADPIPQASTPPPQQNKEMNDEEKDEDVDIGYNTPVIHDEFWEKTHPNSPLATPIPQLHESLAATEIQTGSQEKRTLVKSVPKTESVASAKDTTNTSTEETVAPEADKPAQHIPQTEKSPAEEHVPQTEDNTTEPHVDNPQSAVVVAEILQTENLRRLIGRFKPNLQPTVQKNHYYLHEIFERTWPILSHLKTSEELTEMEFQQDFDWSCPPKKKFKEIPAPPLVASSFSTTRTTREAEELDATVATNDPKAPPPSKK